MIAPNHGLSGEQLAAPNRCTETVMKANGFGIGLLATTWQPEDGVVGGCECVEWKELQSALP